jgi:hypothetical protein
MLEIKNLRVRYGGIEAYLGAGSDESRDGAQDV